MKGYVMFQRGFMEETEIEYGEIEGRDREKETDSGYLWR